MEFLLLALLILVGLATAFDGGDDNGSDGGGDGNDSLDDVLTGSGTARVFGGAGGDTIYVQDDAVGDGLKGNNSLTGADKATTKGGEGDDWLELSGDAHGDGGDGTDTLTAEGRTSLYGGDGDDMMSGHGTREGGSGNDRLELSYGRDVSTDRAKILLYGQADGGDGNDTIIASSGVLDGDTYTTSGTMALSGGAGDDYISASAIYKIDAGSGDDTVSIASDATKSQDHQGVILGEGNDVAVAPVSLFGDYYGIHATFTDFNPAEDRLAIIVEEGPTAPVAIYTWYAELGGTVVRDDDGVEFALVGVNHQVTPLSVSFYAIEAALRAGIPCATA